ncbi:hypothetical protein [Xenorhabdus beddingii]|nr:hypothetical protein [Xenorhabdus beddingii]
MAKPHHTDTLPVSPARQLTPLLVGIRACLLPPAELMLSLYPTK